MGFEDDDIQQFAMDLEGSQAYSIDLFLKNRPEYIEIGKLAIAQALIPFENLDKLLNLSDDHWLRYIRNTYMESLKFH